jgi:hypothetical protein
MTSKRGVYFLANNYVRERVIAFLNSFRRYNEHTPVCFIPFDADIDEIVRLQEQYDFSIWSGDPAVLRRCDEISLQFHDVVRGHYRKLAAWEGEFDEFIYIDTDTVVLQNLDFVFEFLGRFGFLAAYSDNPWGVEWVWNDSVAKTGALSPDQIGYAAGTGFLASRKECLRFADVLPQVPAAVELAPHMRLLCVEMPLLNYLIVRSPWPRSSLEVLATTEGPTDMPLERWAGQDMGEIRDGLPVLQPGTPPVLLIHWAGLWWELAKGEHPDLPYRDLWQYWRDLEPSLAGGHDARLIPAVGPRLAR